MKKLILLALALALAGCGTDLMKPAPPEGLSAIAGNAEVTLWWDSPRGKESVAIYQGTGGEELTHATTTPANDPVTITGLANGTTYRFAARTIDAYGNESDLTAEVTARPVLHACKDDMDETRAARGAPEEVNTYSSSGYRSEDWWYWTQGYNVTFAWGRNVGGCDVSVYTFDPIY